MQTSVLEKLIWDEADFEQMGWHDSTIYAMSFDSAKFELALDIDYIVKWIEPIKPESNFKFWVAPAILVFRNVYDLNIGQYSLNFEIQDIHRENPVKPKNAKYTDGYEYDWRIETTEGEITFKAIGYKQYFKKPPVLLDSQKIDFTDRGGISFERSF